MRKGQANIVEKAKKRNLPALYINWLEESKESIAYIKDFYDFLKGRYKYKKSRMPENGTEEYKDDTGKLIYDQIFALQKNAYKRYILCHHLSRMEDESLFLLLKEDFKTITGAVYFLEVNQDLQTKDCIDLVKEGLSAKTPENKIYLDVFKELCYLTTDQKQKINQLSFLEKCEVIDYRIHIYKEEKSAVWEEKIVPAVSNLSDLLEYCEEFNGIVFEIKNYIQKGVSKDKIIKCEIYESKIREFIQKSQYWGGDQNWSYFSDQKPLRELEEMFKKLNSSFMAGTFNLKKPITSTRYSISKDALNFTLSRHSQVEVFIDWGGRIKAKYKFSRSNINRQYVFFFDTGQLYYKSNKGGLFPASLKILSRDGKLYQEPFYEIMEFLFDLKAEEGYFLYKDIKPYLYGPALFSVSFNELENYHNRNHLFQTKYKKEIPINWNKGDLNLHYFFYKSYEMVDEKSKSRFLEIHRTMNRVSYKTLSEFIQAIYTHDIDFLEKPWIEYLAFIIFNNLKEESYPYDGVGKELITKGDMFHLCVDYVSISLRIKHKVSLLYSSGKKLKEAHDERLIEFTTKNNKEIVVKVPKNSQFLKLRKVLPDSFEWIRSKRRLIAEGIRMNHCVATYYDFINKDKSAIYSYTHHDDSHTPYTIEFKVKNGEYHIAQIQSRSNHGCPKEVREFVSSCIAG